MVIDAPAVEELVDPRGVVSRPDPAAVERRPFAWNRWNIAFFSNSKANADVLLEEVEHRFARETPGLTFTRVRKPSAGAPAERDVLVNLPTVSDAVVLASAD